MAKMNWNKIPKGYKPAYERKVKAKKGKYNPRMATKAQKAYLKVLGIKVPKDCTRKSAYSMINLKVIANEKLKEN